MTTKKGKKITGGKYIKQRKKRKNELPGQKRVIKLSDEEKRMGMRSGLRNSQRACVECKKIPTSMESTECNVCGKYKIRRVKWKEEI